MILLLAIACGPTLPDCEEGQHITADGACADDPPIEGSEHFPACEPEPASDRINVRAGCADGACNDADFPTINDALGEDGLCDNDIGGLSFCSWLGDTLHSFFQDDDGDGLPDTGATASGIYLYPGYDGTTEEGLGVGVSLACWVDTYGYTDEVEYAIDDDGESYISELFWTSVGLFVDDNNFDGVADRVSLFGS